MNNKLLVLIAVISLLLNVGAVSLLLSNNVNAQSALINVPPLTKDAGYILTIPSTSIICVDIENKVGLQSGDIDSIITNLKGDIIIYFKKGLLLDSNKVQSITDMVKGLVPDIKVK